MQNYLVFQSAYRYFITNSSRTIANGRKVTAWELKEKSDEKIKPPSMFDNCLNPTMNYIDVGKIRVKFDGSCL